MDFAVALQGLGRADIASHDLVFKRLMPDMDRFRADLRAAGIRYVNDKGEHADFYSLRKTLATELEGRGVNVQRHTKVNREQSKRVGSCPVGSRESTLVRR